MRKLESRQTSLSPHPIPPTSCGFHPRSLPHIRPSRHPWQPLPVRASPPPDSCPRAFYRLLTSPLAPPPISSSCSRSELSKFQGSIFLRRSVNGNSVNALLHVRHWTKEPRSLLSEGRGKGRETDYLKPSGKNRMLLKPRPRGKVQIPGAQLTTPPPGLSVPCGRSLLDSPFPLHLANSSLSCRARCDVPSSRRPACPGLSPG